MNAPGAGDGPSGAYMPISQVEIHGLAHGGEGVGRPVTGDDQRVWFVAGALPGERVWAKPLHVHKRFIRGAVEHIDQASPARVVPPCSLAGTCGGCNWQHVAADRQLELKRDIVANQLRHLANVPTVRLGAAAGNTYYRRRARMHYRRGDQFEVGFYQKHGDDVVDVHTCLALEPVLLAALAKVRKLAAYLPQTGSVHGLSNGKQVVLGLPVEGSLAQQGPALVMQCRKLLDDTLIAIELRGDDRQSLRIGPTTLAIDGGVYPAIEAGAFSFAQANAEVNQALVEHVCEAGDVAATQVLEVYAGSGNFTRALVSKARRVVAIESAKDAVERLKNLSGTVPVEVLGGDANRRLTELIDAGRRFDVTVVDPPRRGLGKQVVHALSLLTLRRVVYVSCDPATLARDLRALTERGFGLRDVTVFDLMPMTSQIETVAVLERGPV